MEKFKEEFVKFLVQEQALKFGEFVLKSGRKAPYFLNTGSFYSGRAVNMLAKFYAQAFVNYGVEADVIFGPAYKGIPLAVGMVAALYEEFGKNLNYCFNRKEAKTYADKSAVVGAPLNENTKVFLIDDVITAGTAMRETMEFLKANGNPQIQGVLIALNRMEKNNDGKNAITELESELGVKAHWIVDLDELLEILYNREVDGKIYIDDAMMETIKAYRVEYGI
jgi:orotate phosphoribosyltransferase